MIASGCDEQGRPPLPPCVSDAADASWGGEHRPRPESGGSRGPAGPGRPSANPGPRDPNGPRDPAPRSLSGQQDRPQHPQQTPRRVIVPFVPEKETAVYDYIIVGAGSAGCVLAARLSADSSVKVLLLEAGPVDDAQEIQAPAALSRLFQSAYDWNYNTVPQHRAAGRSIYWPRGRVLGGSSSMNAMIYIRGNRRDFQAWRDEHGCSGWGYEDLMPYFRRSEDNSRGASAYHGTGGPLAVSDVRYKSPACEAFIAAAREQGATANEDFNGPRQDGVGWYQVTQRKGRRCSAAAAYLHPVMSRPNLNVHTGALVTEIFIEDGQATGGDY